MRNAQRHLDAYSLSELGIYVYGLIDPESNRVIYVGKGGGKFEDGSGNLRVFSHFEDTERQLRRAEKELNFEASSKCLAIAAVWARGQDVRVHFYRRRLRDEREAFHVEGAVIAALSTSVHGETDNANDGMHLQEHGGLTLQAALDRGALPVNPTFACRALLFNIGTSLALRPGRTPRDVYECTRFAWANLAQPATDVIAIGYSDDISRGGYQYPRWDMEPDGRLSFTAAPENWLDQRHELIGRNYSAILALTPWRLWNGVIGVEFDGVGSFNIFRGAPAEVAGRAFPCAPVRNAASDSSGR
jgi:hypothetical protein